MSLLERLGRGHLGDQDFARIRTAGTTHPHLDRCAGCRARSDAFDAWLLGVGDELRAAADEAFPAERLALQHAQIARRLETLERPARVILFPKAARAVISGNSHVRRWVTVAAAASLIAGFGLGQVMPLHTAVRQQSTAVAPNFTAPEAATRAEALTPPASANSDEDLLSDDFASPRVRNLSALDDMTPHARDYGMRAK